MAVKTLVDGIITYKMGGWEIIETRSVFNFSYRVVDNKKFITMVAKKIRVRLGTFSGTYPVQGDQFTQFSHPPQP